MKLATDSIDLTQAIDAKLRCVYAALDIHRADNDGVTKGVDELLADARTIWTWLATPSQSQP